MRRAFINTQALREHLGSLRGAHETLDLRANAYGLGLAKTSEIAAEVGFARVVASPGDSEASVLPIDPVSETALTNWWDSPEAFVTFEADVISLKRVGPGTPVSYGYEYRTATATTLALVSAGFSDGVPRTASPGARMSIRGIDFPVAGRIAMDQCILDVGDSPIDLGESVTIWGASPTLSDWSLWSRRPTGAVQSHLATRVVRTWM